MGADYHAFATLPKRLIPSPPPSFLPGDTVSRTVLRAVVVQLVTSDMALFGLAVVEQVLLVQKRAIRACIPLLATSVSLLIGRAGFFRSGSVVNLL